MCARDRDGTTKGGTGRVAIYRQTALPHLYTIEANYHGASHGASHGAPGGAAFDVQAFHQVRRGERAALLCACKAPQRACRACISRVAQFTRRRRGVAVSSGWCAGGAGAACNNPRYGGRQPSQLRACEPLPQHGGRARVAHRLHQGESATVAPAAGQYTKVCGQDPALRWQSRSAERLPPCCRWRAARGLVTSRRARSAPSSQCARCQRRKRWCPARCWPACASRQRPRRARMASKHVAVQPRAWAPRRRRDHQAACATGRGRHRCPPRARLAMGSRSRRRLVWVRSACMTCVVRLRSTVITLAP